MGYNHIKAILPLNLAASEKLLLVVMAHHANVRYHLIYNSVRTLAAETGLSERQVQRNLRSLEQEAILTLIEAPKGRTRRYQIDLDTVKCLIEAQRGDNIPTMSVTPGVTSETNRGDTGVTRKGIERELKEDLRKGCATGKPGTIRWPHVHCADGSFPIPPRYDHSEDFSEAFREWFRERISSRGSTAMRVSHLVKQFSLLDALPFEEALDQMIKAAAYGTNNLVNEDPAWLTRHSVCE